MEREAEAARKRAEESEAARARAEAEAAEAKRRVQEQEELRVRAEQELDRRREVEAAMRLKAEAEVAAANARIAEEQAGRKKAEDLVGQRDRDLGAERNARAQAEQGLAAAIKRAEDAARLANEKSQEAANATRRAEVCCMYCTCVCWCVRLSFRVSMWMCGCIVCLSLWKLSVEIIGRGWGLDGRRVGAILGRRVTVMT